MDDTCHSFAFDFVFLFYIANETIQILIKRKRGEREGSKIT